MAATPQFDHERLEVYQVHLQFITWLTELFEELQGTKRGRLAETLDQLDRASISTLLNIAEGNGRRASQQRVRFLDDARGSATECAACLDALVAKRAAVPLRVSAGKVFLVRVVSMLTKLIEAVSARIDAAETDGDSRTRTSRSRRTI